jgi:N-acetylneuraminate synthase/N,N'-diacetyllegionaminate synthase
MITQHEIAIGERRIGAAWPCYVIAEAGVNHDGDPDKALRLVDAAADAGADAVKFQTFRAEAVAAAQARKADYQVETTGADGGQLEMLRALELSEDAFAAIAAHCRARGVAFMSTAFDAASLAFVDSLDPPALKWPSGEIDNLPLLRAAARLGRPVVLSTGMAGMAEIERALAELDAGGCPGVAVLHCTSNYPARPEDLNLRAIPAMAAVLGRPTGFSDHSEGSAAALAARALGMAVLEKHFTLDRAAPGPDHRASIEPDELRRLIADLRAVEAALGDGVKRIRAAERGVRAVARRGLRAARDIAEGEVLGMDNLVALRPAEGVSPAFIDMVAGRRTRRALAAGEPLLWTDVA